MLFANTTCPQTWPGYHPAPDLFRQYLKKELGDDHDCWFSSRHEREQVVSGGVNPREYTKGCWVIWQRFKKKVTCKVGQFTVSAIVPVWAEVFALDGLYGNPVTLGRWVVHALKESDLARNPSRFRQLDEINEQDKRQEYMQKWNAINEMSKDRMMKYAVRQMAAQMGKETPSGDQRKQAVREWAARENAFEQEMEFESKQVRFYGTR